MIRHGHDERASHLRPRGLFCVAICVLALVVVGFISVGHVVGSGFGFVCLVRQTSERVVQAAERMIRTQPPALHQVFFRASRSTSTSTSTTPSTSIGRVQRRPGFTPHVSAHSMQRASPQPYPPCELGLAVDVPSRPSFNNRSTEPNRFGGTSNMLKYGESTLRTFRVLKLARVTMP